MIPVTNVAFDHPERQVFERAALWGGLAESENSPVLRRLAKKDPTGIQHHALMTAWHVLTAILTKAHADIALFRHAAEHGPETASEGLLIARPRQAAQTIVQTREQAVRQVGEALDLVNAALTLATAPHVEMAT